MKSGRMLLAGIAASGVFGLGYLAGQSATIRRAGDAASSSPSASGRQAGHGDDASSPSAPDRRSATKPNPRTTTADATPNPEKAFSRRIVAMMSTGELSVIGVSIDNNSLLPGGKVKEFLDLTDEQFEKMQQMGRDRLKAMQEHEQSITTTVKASEDEIVFDVPADAAFAAREKAAYIEEMRREFGPDVAAVLQCSIGQAYTDFLHPRHVRYTILPNPNTVPDDAPDFIREMQEGIRNFKISVNVNDDGTFMTSEDGVVLPVCQSSSGTFNLNSNNPDEWIPRYHYLWQRQQGQ